MKSIITAISILIAISTHSAIAADQPGIVMPINFFDMSEKEQQTYISGVLDGQMFMLYSSQHPDLAVFQKCAKTEGAKAIAIATQNRLALGDDLKYPTPWAISSAMGLVCSKYRGK
ncbi:hypothetical protein KAR91_13270 [Candidatus Pacearchaeota archaeon]|nr:hypothetical protein [Candidatus Pacearchaeota archaeon]